MWPRIVLLSGLGALSSAAWAEGHAVSAKAGALGLGVEYSYALTQRVNLRAGLNGWNLGFDGEEAGIDYEIDLIWDSLSLAVDLHPGTGPFRITGGILNNDNGLRMLSQPAGDIDVGGVTYAPAEVGTLRGGVAFDDTAPFFSIGWDWWRAKRRFGVSFDMGILSQGSPRVALSADGLLADNLAFLADLEAERLEIEDSLESLDLFPFATLGFAFRF